MGGISIWQLLILLVIVVLLFGTKKLKNIGKDAGEAVKGFKSAMNDGEQEAAQSAQSPQSVEHKPQTQAQAKSQVNTDTQAVVEGEVIKKESERG